MTSTETHEISQEAARAAVDTSSEAIGRSITELMGWLTGPDSGQNYGLVTAANQLAEVARQRDAMLAALRRAEQFIANGVELGFIRMPDPSTPDSAHETLPAIRVAIALAEACA